MENNDNVFLLWILLKELVVNTSEGDRALACFLSVPATESRGLLWFLSISHHFEGSVCERCSKSCLKVIQEN